jgi:hypothetical protein
VHSTGERDLSATVTREVFDQQVDALDKEED